MTLICSRELGKEINLFLITNKGHLPGDIVIHTIFLNHVEAVTLITMAKGTCNQM